MFLLVMIFLLNFHFFYFKLFIYYLFVGWLFCNNHVNHHINSNFLLYLISHVQQILEGSESVWHPFTRVFQASSSQNIVTLLNLTVETIILLCMIFHAVYSFYHWTDTSRTILFCIQSGTLVVTSSLVLYLNNGLKWTWLICKNFLLCTFWSLPLKFLLFQVSKLKVTLKFVVYWICRSFMGNRLSGPFPTVLTNITTLKNLYVILFLYFQTWVNPHFGPRDYKHRT